MSVNLQLVTCKNWARGLAALQYFPTTAGQKWLSKIHQLILTKIFAIRLKRVLQDGTPNGNCSLGYFRLPSFIWDEKNSMLWQTKIYCKYLSIEALLKQTQKSSLAEHKLHNWKKNYQLHFPTTSACQVFHESHKTEDDNIRETSAQKSCQLKHRLTRSIWQFCMKKGYKINNTDQ